GGATQSCPKARCGALATAAARLGQRSIRHPRQGDARIRETGRGGPIGYRSRAGAKRCIARAAPPAGALAEATGGPNRRGTATAANAGTAGTHRHARSAAASSETCEWRYRRSPDAPGESGGGAVEQALGAVMRQLQFD